MADINANNNYTDMKTLTPFKLCVLQNFPFIEADFDAVTNYQLLCKVVEYLNNIIDNSNKQNDNITQLEQNFIKLYNYVKNFFDNLDVQEEINDKIDKMILSGQFQSILMSFTKIGVPEFFGAKGDGITNDSESFINALNNCDILLCSNVYKINITIPDNKKIVGGSFSAFDKTKSIFTLGDNITLDNMIISSEVGNYGNDARGIYGINNKNVFLSNIELYNISRAVILFNNSTNINLDNITIHDCGSENVNSTLIELLTVSNININNLTMYNFYGETVLIRKGSLINMSNVKCNDKKGGGGSIITLETVTKANIFNIDINNVNHTGIEINASKNVNALNIKTNGCAENGILISTFQENGVKEPTENVIINNVITSDKILIVSANNLTLDNIKSSSTINLTGDNSGVTSVTIINSAFEYKTITGTSANNAFLKTDGDITEWIVNNVSYVKITNLSNIFEINKYFNLDNGEEKTFIIPNGSDIIPLTVDIFSYFKDNISQNSKILYNIYNNNIDIISEIDGSVKRALSISTVNNGVKFTNNSGVNLRSRVKISVV